MRFAERLKNRALSTAKVYAVIPENKNAVLGEMDEGAVGSLYNRSIIIINEKNKIEYTFSDQAGESITLDQETINRIKKEGGIYFPVGARMAYATFRDGEEGGFILAMAASDKVAEEYLNQLGKILLFACLLGLVLTFGSAIIFAKRLIVPIKRITEEVNLITSRNLSQRVYAGESRDELSLLAETFNNLLDRLQDSFAIQSRFISNASHELSNPLTSISSQLEVAMQKNRSTEEYREVIESVHEDIVELQQLTRSLLDIAKTGTQEGIDLSVVRIDEILLKVMSAVQKQNLTYRVKMHFGHFPEEEKRLTVFGNANLLYIALKNIVENGCKYSDDQSAKVTVLFNPSSIIVVVFNKGDVIAESDIQNVFHPFFRSETVQKKPGFGLGLTLTRRILSLHKGTIEVESTPDKGTTFTVELPNSASTT